MGLFSSSKKTYVSSSMWNMAGDPEDLPRVLPSLVLSSVLVGAGNQGLGTTLVRNLRSTTFMRSQSFFRWARSNYTFGMPEASLGADFSPAGHEIGPALRTALGVTSTQEVEVLSARVEEIYLGHWAEDWLRRNRPGIALELGLADGGWEVSYDTTTDELTIEMPSESVTLAAPADLLWALANTRRRLLYVAYRIHTQNTGTGLWSAGTNQLFTYRMGSGNVTFDALVPTPEELVEFAPAIPLRIDNQSISSHPQFDHASKAYRKLTGGQLSDVLEEIEDHSDIGDMDYIFVVQGVPLNTKNPAAQAYIYQFFWNLMSLQPVTINSTIYLENRRDDAIAQAAWAHWEAVNGSSPVFGPSHPYLGALPPSASLVRDAGNDLNVLRVTMAGLDKFDLRIQWGSIQERIRVGNAARFDGVSRPLLKKGSFWIRMLPDVSLTFPPGASGLNGSWFGARKFTRMVVLHQHEAKRYRMLEITDLAHVNMIYKNKSVDIGAREALADEELSGFLLPLHIPTVKQIGAVRSAELTGHTTHLMINSYQVVKKKWYQRGIFKIVMVVVTIAFTVISGGIGALATAPGILGTNAAVGAMLGVTGVMGAVVGAVANGIAGIVLSTLIVDVTAKTLGDKWGAVLSQIITVVTMKLMMSYTTTGSLNIDWGSMFRMDNLLALTDAVTGTYSAYLYQDTLGIQDAMAEASEDYTERMREIREHSREILGSTNIGFDATLLTDAAEHFGESSESFLSRTLMTGGDLAQMSHMLIEGFADLTLELPRSP